MKIDAFKWLLNKNRGLGIKMYIFKKLKSTLHLKQFAMILWYITNFLFGEHDWQENMHNTLLRKQAFLAC